MSKPSTLRSANTCRAYAEEMRVFAEHMHDPGARAMMLRNAESWEAMAARDEEAAARQQQYLEAYVQLQKQYCMCTWLQDKPTVHKLVRRI